MPSLPVGFRVSKLRIDAAGYQAAILDYAVNHLIDYSARAKMSAELREMILSHADSDWQPMVTRNGKPCFEESSCRLTHVMQASQHPFTAVVQRRAKKGQQSFELGSDSDGTSIEHGGYLFRAIATNREELTDSELVHWYIQRAEHSGNRIKELKNDFAASQLPCGDFQANEFYFALCGLAYNVFALMRQLFPKQWAQSRASTIRWRLYALAGKLVRHGR